jgi:leucyl-tRNA synthetase
VKAGACERCHTDVIQKKMTQWFFRITAYADELLVKLDELDWPEKTKRIQRNWIGKSVGAKVNFQIDNINEQIEVFTTRIDTLLGATYLVLAPEHPLVEMIVAPEYREAILSYQMAALKLTEIERMSTIKEKTGVFSGAYAVHPISGERIPIWISDYVIASYGMGAVMAVPAHDQRDYDFATEFNLPVRQVIKPIDSSVVELPFVDEGVLISSGEFDGLTSSEAAKRITSQLHKSGHGDEKVSYRLRDWLISRQRYWGAPIPVVHCEKCGIVPVPEESLPVLLPYDVEFMPTGESPLAKCADFVNTPCPKCGSPAKRETETMDTFVCSSWYYLRFYDNHNDQEAFDRNRVNHIMPVDKYIGGIEHAAMHLLYARFITKVLRDIGYLDFDEPFQSLIHQGTILGFDGLKMSKSSPNAVSPDKFIEQYGSDVFRMYLGFGFSYEDGGLWSDDGIKAIARFISRIEHIISKHLELQASTRESDYVRNCDLEFARYYAIKNTTADLTVFHFNTAIARITEFASALVKYQAGGNRNMQYEDEVLTDLLLIIAPFAPHFCEDAWEKLGKEYSIFNRKWPEYDEAALQKDKIEIAIQINGSIRERILIPSDFNDDEVKTLVLANEKVQKIIGDKSIKRMIIIKNRLVNIVF